MLSVIAVTVIASYVRMPTNAHFNIISLNINKFRDICKSHSTLVTSVGLNLAKHHTAWHENIWMLVNLHSSNCTFFFFFLSPWTSNPIKHDKIKAQCCYCLERQQKVFCMCPPTQPGHSSLVFKTLQRWSNACCHVDLKNPALLWTFFFEGEMRSPVTNEILLNAGYNGNLPIKCNCLFSRRQWLGYNGRYSEINVNTVLAFFVHIPPVF